MLAEDQERKRQTPTWTMDFWIEKLSSVIIDLPTTVILNDILKFSKLLFKNTIIRHSLSNCNKKFKLLPSISEKKPFTFNRCGTAHSRSFKNVLQFFCMINSGSTLGIT